MAEQLFRKRLREEKVEGVELKSAGVGAAPDAPSPPQALEALKRFGLDGSAHRSRVLSADLVDWADLILGMDGMHQMVTASRFPRSVGRVHILKSYAGAEGRTDIADPIGKKQETYDKCAAEIEAALKKLLEKLKDKEKPHDDPQEDRPQDL